MAEPTRKRHVAVLAFPFGNHAAPLLSVIRRLATAAPGVHFSFFSTAKSNSFLFSSSDAGDGVANLRAYNVSDGVPVGHVFTGKTEEEIELFLTAALESFRRGLAAAEAEVGLKVRCLVTDAFFSFAAEMAAEMEAAWVVFWASNARALSAHLLTDLIREKIGIKDVDLQREETLGFIHGMSKIRAKDLPEGVVFGNLNSLFSKMLYQMGQALPQALSVVANSFEDLEPPLTLKPKSKFKCYLSIGPLNLLPPTTKSKPDSHGCLAWMESQRHASVAYIGFGTVATPPPKELLAIAEALEASKVPFIWSLKEKDRVHLPKGFLEKTREQGMVVPWAPQVELLKHKATGVFVTHCGWNSVLESLASGVPMICRPFFGDHRLNSRAVEAVWETGVTISGGVLTKDGLKECLDQVLAHEDGIKMRENARRIKDAAHESVSAKGISTQNFAELLEIVSSTPST